MSKINRIQELVKQLNVYRNEYYNLNKPTVSDVTYDKLFDELSNLEKETGYILSNSPTQTVGYEVKSKLSKVEHPIPLKSLSKTKSIDELIKWCGNHDILLMIKADGLTVELLYDNGNLIQASTRGNSIIGEDISHNAKVFKNIPLTIPFKGLLRIAGEAIIHKNDFNKINSKLSDEEKYATPRNLVAGSVRQLDSKICSQREVYFQAFGILECSEKLSDSKCDRLSWLSNNGFDVIYNIVVDKSNLEGRINRAREVAEQCFIPYDGMVITFDSVKYSKSLGETSHHPLHSIAFKFADESETTTLRDIEWSVGRTGVITPVAIFDTVILDNTEVSRASVHNLSICEELELGIEDSISIIKANQIIPQIEENFTRSNNLVIPETCPVCGGKTVIQQLNNSKMLYCTNNNCKAKLLFRTKHMVSRDALNIEGLNERTIQKMIDLKYINQPWDIFDLPMAKILKIEGYAQKSATKLWDAIQKARNCDFDRAIYACGIELVGRKVSKDIAKEFETIDNLLYCLRRDDARSILGMIDGIGDTTIDSLLNNVNILENMVDYLSISSVEKKETTFKSLENITFVVTGNVETFKNRKELEELITSLGGKLSGSVSSKTNYLINNDITSTSGKNKKANELNIPIISEQMFNELIGR